MSKKSIILGIQKHRNHQDFTVSEIQGFSDFVDFLKLPNPPHTQCGKEGIQKIRRKGVYTPCHHRQGVYPLSLDTTAKEEQR